jgi:hypothetical protein
MFDIVVVIALQSVYIKNKFEKSIILMHFQAKKHFEEQSLPQYQTLP